MFNFVLIYWHGFPEYRKQIKPNGILLSEIILRKKYIESNLLSNIPVQRAGLIFFFGKTSEHNHKYNYQNFSFFHKIFFLLT